MSTRRSPWEESNEAGLHAFERGEFEAAEERFRSAVEEAEKDDPGGVPLAKSLNNLAETCRALRKYADAERFFRRALAVKEQALGKSHPEVATGLSNLAGLHYECGDLAGAALLFKQALAIAETSLGPEHPEAARCLANLAGVYHMQQRSVEAEALYRSALDMREKALGPHHPDVAGTLTNLAAVYRSQGKEADADDCLARAAAIERGVRPRETSRAATEPDQSPKRTKGTGSP